MQELYQFQTAGKIIAGRDSLHTLGGHLDSVAAGIRSALVVAQPFTQRSGILDGLLKQLAEKGIQVQVTLDILPEPTLENIEEVYRKTLDAAGASVDVIIGIGGGSVLDAAKILSVLGSNGGSIRGFLGTNLIKQAGIPTVLIPTTSGTGAEVTPNAIVTIPEEELKIGVVSPYLLPQLVILDPMVTLGLPQAVTAATGMDAFTHSLESFISNKANPISDMFALESIRLISSSILEAYHNGSSVEARENMLLGSMYGGMALTSAGTAAVHALAYPLGGKFKIAHGVANSMLLPHVMEFNMDAAAARLAVAGEAMGLDVKRLSEQEAAEAVIRRIAEWTQQLNIPQNLQQYGVSEEDVEELSLSAAKVTRLLNNNPKPVSVEDMKVIYRKLLPQSP